MRKENFTTHEYSTEGSSDRHEPWTEAEEDDLVAKISPETVKNLITDPRSKQSISRVLAESLIALDQRQARRATSEVPKEEAELSVDEWIDDAFPDDKKTKTAKA